MAILIAPRNTLSGMLLASLGIDQKPFDERIFPRLGYDIDYFHPEYKSILEKIVAEGNFTTGDRFTKIQYSEGKIYLVAAVGGRFKEPCEYVYDILAKHPLYVGVKEEPSYHTAVFEFNSPDYVETLFRLINEKKINSPTKLLTEQFAKNENIGIEEAIRNIIQEFS
jgi:hypothetical protein